MGKRFLLALLVQSSALSYPASLSAAVQRGMLASSQDGRVHVLGTVHAGGRSAEEARALIDWLAPETLVVEATPPRVAAIVAGTQEKKRPRRTADLGLLADLFASAGCLGALVWLELRATNREETPDDESEFEAAVVAAAAGSCVVVGADWTFDELARRVDARLGWRDWLAVFAGRDQDPIKRRPDESRDDWIDRRRSVDTARASVEHQARTAPALHDVLVRDRDRAFSAAVPSSGTTAVVVGLAHLDGVLRELGRPD